MNELAEEGLERIGRWRFGKPCHWAGISYGIVDFGGIEDVAVVFGDGGLVRKWLDLVI
jgi:hypothetical protein